tara:strand:+ start:55859 stop:64006 length:8148 start_codon:yes stop_codon:yes gene_type:complete
MWEYSSVSDNWEKRVEKLDKRIYNYLRQEIEDVRFYSKCLDGSSYIPVPELDNLYDVLNYKVNDTFKINSAYSSNFDDTDITGGNPITAGDLSSVGSHFRYNEEYGYTIKNLFTPKRLIDDSTNYLTVDIATVESINMSKKYTKIDGIVLKEGHRILVKNNITNITIDTSVDPEEYFGHNYYFVKEIGDTKTYFYFNSENGIYRFTDGNLVRETDLDTYLSNIRYLVHIKLGTNSHVQYHLSRLKNGNFPLVSNNDPIEFDIKKMDIVRNSLEYRNTLDNEFHCGTVQNSESVTILGKVYQIPERFISVGDFGFMINFQDDYSNLLKNKFKEDLKDMVSLSDKYLVVGDNGTLLSLDKLSLEPSYLEQETFENFNSIDFVDNYRGVIVGDNGTILLTRNQFTWELMDSDIKNNLNKVNFKDLSKAIIVGDNGIVKQLTMNRNNNKLEDIELKVKSTLFNERRVLEDIVDIDNISLNKETFLYDGTDWVDLNKNIGGSDFTFDFIFKPTTIGTTASSTLFSFLTEKYPTTTGTTIDKGIKIIVEPDTNGIQRLNMYVNSDIDNSQYITLNGNINIEDDVWYNVLVTRDKGEYKFFVNQTLSDSTTLGFQGNFDNFNTRIRLGAELTYSDGTFVYSATSFNHFIGVIDQVRLFDKPLDENEVKNSNNYLTNIDALITWYKFNTYKDIDTNTKKIRITDLILNTPLILPLLSNLTDYNSDNNLTDGIDTEVHTGIVVSGNNTIAIVLDVPTNYSKQATNNQFYISTDTLNIKNIVYNNSDNYFYGMGDSLFRIDTDNIDVDLFNQINLLDITEEIILGVSYNNLSLDKINQKLYLISGPINQIDSIDISNICTLDIHDPLSNCGGAYVTVSTIDSTNGLVVENDYRNDITDTDNINSINYIKTEGYVESNQSVVQIPITLLGSPLPMYKELYCSFTISDIINGYFEFSLDDINFTPITSDGDYLIPMTVGSSVLTVRAILDISDPKGNRVKGLIENILLYEAECVNLEPASIYTGGSNVQKLYFSQFDTQSQLAKLNNDELYSYIDLKSLTIDGVEQIDLGTYSAEGFPKYLYPGQFATQASVKCGIGGLCDYISYLPNPVTDRIRYGFGLDVNISNYTYVGNSYGLLEGMTVNTSQLFGIDKANIANNISTIDSPYHVGIDYTKSFRFEVDSMILNNDDQMFYDLTGVTGSTASHKIEIAVGTYSVGTADSTYFNQIGFTGSTGLEWDMKVKQFNPGQQYYVEMELDGDISIKIGSTAETFTFSGTGSLIQETIKMSATFSTTADEAVISNDSITANINNFVITDRFPTKSVITWDPDTCTSTYKMSGVPEENVGFLQSSGAGEYLPSCEVVLTCDNSDNIEGIVNEEYLGKFKSKMLFLNYDIASKLYFFDVNSGEYQLPESIIVSNISVLSFNSISGQKSWIDYSKDSTKDFGYGGVKNDSNTIKYSSIFTKTGSISSSYDIILNNISTNDISDINGATQGLLPNFDSGTISIAQSSPPSATHSYYFYQNYMIIKNPSFVTSLGDIIRIENGLVTDNLMVIYILEDSGDTYVYLKTTFNQSITNRLISWVKTTTITNLNNFQNLGELIPNFNVHPISVGYKLSENSASTLLVEPQFNFKTAYYNLQCRVSTTNAVLDVTSQKMEYLSKVLSFGYSARYNILDYLSKNPVFNSNYRLSILPSYNFSNDNAGVLYTVSDGLISFNSSLKAEWESIPKYVFLDLTFGANVLSPILTMNKYYDSTDDRYIIETYNYYGYIYDQSDLGSSNWTLRVRNRLGEISEDLEKMNNIQRSTSTSYHITDLSNNIYTSYETLKSELNFKPDTDSYVKALLNQKEIKEYLSGIVYTDYKNELAINMINLPRCDSYVITGISSYDIDCASCSYSDYTLFTNPGNNIDYNQFSILSSNTYYTNRVPVLEYGFSNNILIIGATGGTSVDVPIDFITQSGTNRVLEFTIGDLVDASIQIVKDTTVVSTILYKPSETERTKTLFTDNGVDDLIIRINYTPDQNRVDLTNIRVGIEECIDNCYLTKLHVEDHDLEVGDGIVIDLTESIFNLENLYDSKFNENPVSGWIKNIGGSTSSVVLVNNIIDETISASTSLYLPDSFTVSIGDTYRITFDYDMTYVSGTPSLSPSFGTQSSNLNNNFENLTWTSNFTHVISNFIPTSSNIYIGFNLVPNSNIKLSSILIDKIEDVGEYYDGYRVVQNIINDTEIVINTAYNGTIEELSSTYSYVNLCGDTITSSKLISNLGSIKKCIFDPYLNYSPIDIYELGKDDKIKQAIEIKPNDWTENSDNTVSISNTIDMNNYRFRLIDELSIVDLNDKYPWVLESEIRKAIIGKDENGIVWYEGIWDCGRWFGGTWYSGDWRNGIWYDGTWNNSEVKDNIIRAEVEVLDSEMLKSIWHNGSFRNGTWNGGEHRDGNFYDGTWNKGDWNDGTWHNGTWNTGEFKRGTWIDGTWNNGKFNCDLGMSSWFDGTWNDGFFECGHWYDGRFDSTNVLSEFGSGSSLSRPSIWENGQFINGEFGIGNTRHDLSIWKTGYWNNGIWHNGTAHQIVFNNGKWVDGVVKDIDVVAFFGNTSGTYFFTLRGDWKFKKGDTLWIINNNKYSSIYGTDSNAGNYKVDKDYISINDGEYTKVLVNKVPTDVLTLINSGGVYAEGYLNNDIPTDDTIFSDKITTIVSHFSNTEWSNGQFKNGIFDGKYFEDGIWEKGAFKSGNFGY